MIPRSMVWDVNVQLQLTMLALGGLSYAKSTPVTSQNNCGTTVDARYPLPFVGRKLGPGRGK